MARLIFVAHKVDGSRRLRLIASQVGRPSKNDIQARAIDPLITSKTPGQDIGLNLPISYNSIINLQCDDLNWWLFEAKRFCRAKTVWPRTELTYGLHSV